MIVAIDIRPNIIKFGYSHIGEHIDGTSTILPPVSQRSLVPAIISHIKKTAGHSIDVISVVAPNTINSHGGKLISPAGLHYHNLKICSPLQKEFNCPTVLHHNATAAAYAQAKNMRLKNNEQLVYIDVGIKSIESGLAQNFGDNLVAAPINLSSQIINASGTSSSTLNNYFYDLFDGKELSQELLNKLGTNEWRLVADTLAIGVHNLVALNNTSCIIIGGIFGEYYKKIIKPLNKKLISLGLDTQTFTVAKPFSIDASLHGAMLFAMQL